MGQILFENLIKFIDSTQKNPLTSKTLYTI
jgi:hypothetical protein